MQNIKLEGGITTKLLTLKQRPLPKDHPLYMHQQDIHTINYCNLTIIWIYFCNIKVKNSNEGGFHFSFQFEKKYIDIIIYSQ